MNKKALGIAGATAALVVTFAAIPATADEAPRVDVEDMLPVLGEPQTAHDHLPTEFPLDAFGGVRPETVRSLGADDKAEYWLGRAGSSNICLMLHIPGGAEITAATCGSITDFYKGGLALEAGAKRQSPNSSAQAYLLPSNVDAAALGSMLTKVSSGSDGIRANLLTRQSSDTTPVRPADLKRGSGEVFTFNPLTPAGK